MLGEDWLTLGGDREVEMEDYFMPVTKATGLGKKEREDSDEESNFQEEKQTAKGSD